MSSPPASAPGRPWSTEHCGGQRRAPCGQPGSVHALSPTVRYDLNNPAKHAKLDFLNNLATGLVFIIVVVNIFITAFGVQKPVLDMASRQ